ncbi:hypothetical protein CWE34_12035 [Bacillus sp. SN10]|nr:hypothetical protein CWE34_12035 [Bacillus sp. SN10]
MALGGGQSLGARTLHKQAELLLKIDKELERVFNESSRNPHKKAHIGDMPVFLKKPTLRVCKILYSFFANPVTNKNLKTVPG